MAVGRLGVAWKLQDRLVSVTNALVAAALDARTKVTYSWKSQSTARRRLKKSLGLWGDVNIRPQELTTWSDIRALGYHETFELYEQREGKQLPCTCKGATRNDTLVFSRHFAASFSQAFVSQSKSVTQKTATSSSSPSSVCGVHIRCVIPERTKPRGQTCELRVWRCAHRS